MAEFQVKYDNTPFLKTSKTSAHANRLNWRCELLFTRNAGIVRGNRVLDLASHDGRFSYGCLQLGAAHVTGVEVRQHLVDHSIANLTKLGYGEKQFRFVQGDIFDVLPTFAAGQFDTILCLGVYYHTIRQIELMRHIQRLQPAHFVLDTYIVRERFSVKVSAFLRKRKAEGRWPSNASQFGQWFRAPYLLFREERYSRDGSTIDPNNIVAAPTKSLVELLLRCHGFREREILWSQAGINDWSHLDNYKVGKRVSYLAERVNPA